MKVLSSLLSVIALICYHTLLIEGIVEETCTNTQDGFCVNSDPSVVPEKSAKIAKGANEKGVPPEASMKDCHDRYLDHCPRYAEDNQCTINPGWMIVNCPKSCNACHLRDPKIRCDREYLNISTTPIYQPGDMERIFSNLQTKFGAEYPITVLSTSPWVVTIDNFVSDEETDAILDAVNDHWERSTDTGKVNEFGEAGRTVSLSRTSSNAWCRRECETNPLVQQVVHRIETFTEIPSENYESFQILRYEEGQYYRVHHDMGSRQVLLPCGPRILTFFLYLSDVEEGGETHFPQLGLKVKPKKGSAVLWPSVLNHDVERQDYRTVHEAMPVIKGVKFAANSWIHLYNFEKPNLWGCTGAFDYI